MITTNLFEISNIYKHTIIILGAGSFIMGLTLITLRGALKNSGSRSKSGLLFLALALLVLSGINFLEYATDVDNHRERNSLSLVVFSASIELFLIFLAYMSMLCKEFVTKKRMCFELICIALFTIPACFASPDNHPLLFDILFTTGLVFYCVKLICNCLEYRKQVRNIRDKIETYLSNESNVWLKWINNTFYVVLAIGVVSVIAPMTNMTVLMFYNVFLFFAYLYVYISVIQNISIFDSDMSILEGDEMEDGEAESLEEISLESDLPAKPTTSFISLRQKLLDEWIAERGYAVVGITATEVAKRLKTNRTKLSHYLKNDLNTTYYEWIARLRVEDAKRQLIEYPDRTIYEIALNVGIEDRDNFRRIFQRFAGVSPTSYRKQYTGEN